MSQEGWQPAGEPRRLTVKGSGGVAATVMVTVRQGEVWMSVIPPFTWEAIMGAKKVHELIGMLTQAANDAEHMACHEVASITKA